MNYISEMKTFWQLVKLSNMKTAEIVLWCKLFDLANESGWAEWFAHDNKTLAASIRVSENTMRKAREKLVERKMIEYSEGQGSNRGVYHLNSLLKRDIVLVLQENAIYTADYTSKTDAQLDVQSNARFEVQPDIQLEVQADKERKEPKERNNNNINYIIYKNKTETETKDNAAVVAFEEFIGNANGLIRTEIEKWLAKVNVSLIIYAIEEAVKNDKPSWSYIQGVLENHYQNGRETREAAEAHSAMRKEIGFDPDELDQIIC